MNAFIRAFSLLAAVAGSLAVSADMLPAATARSQLDKVLDTRLCTVAWSEDTAINTFKSGLVLILR